MPGSNVLATSSLSGVSAAGWYSVTFATPANVTAGTSYAIVAYTADDAFYHWIAIYPGRYANGALYYSQSSPPSSWIGTGASFAFKTYVSPPTADLSLSMVGPDTAFPQVYRHIHHHGT